MSGEPDSQYPPRPTALAHRLAEAALDEGALAIDATAGNGHDTVFLAERVGETGRVLAFDVQPAAIEVARQRVAAAGWAERVEFLTVSHADLAAHAEPGAVALVMFNLGYLPGTSHDLTTHAETTLPALDAAVRVLRAGGALSVVCYPGHPAGGAEAEAVEGWFARLAGGGWRVARYGALGTRRPAPFLLFAVAPAGK